MDNSQTHTKAFEAAAGLIRELITARQLLKDRLDDDEIVNAFKVVGNNGLRAAPPRRLEAIALLGKAAEVSKPIATHVAEYISTALKEPLPPMGDWGDAEDRKYLAKAVQSSNELWQTMYAARELAAAGVNEKLSKEIWAEIAVQRSADLSSILEVVAKTLENEHPSLRESAIDGKSRRTQRIIVMLSEMMAFADKPVGESFGKHFFRMVLVGFGSKGPESRELREDSAKGVLDGLYQLLRLKFSITLDPDVYKAARLVRNWWNPATPPKGIEELCEKIVHIAMTTIHTLARQGVAERSVRDALADSIGRQIVDRIGTAVAKSDPSLSPEISHWLKSGRLPAKQQTSDAARELNERDFDEAVARLLIALDAQHSDFQTINLIADEIDVLEPVHADTIRAFSKRSLLVSQWGTSVVRQRALRLEGERSSIVDFDPALHHSSEAIPVSRKARIRTPAVIKQSPGLTPRVILKAEVVPV